MTTLYGIKNCDTMKKARAWLDANAVSYTFHDYKKAGIERKQLALWVKQLGWEALLNKRGTTYRKLPDAVKASLDQASAIDAMLEQPSMIKRPVLVLQATTKVTPIVGFDADAYKAALLSDH